MTVATVTTRDYEFPLSTALLEARRRANNITTDLFDPALSPEDLAARIVATREAVGSKPIVPTGTGVTRIASLRDADSGELLATYMDKDLVEEFLLDSTEGGLILIHVSDNEYRIAPSKSLDRLAYAKYTHARAHTLYFTAGLVVGDTATVWTEDVVEALRYYNAYLPERIRMIREAYREKMQDNTVVAHPADRERKPVRSGGGDYPAFMRKFQQNLVTGINPFEDLTLLDHGTLSSRRWGIEIEAVDIAGVETPAYWKLHGDGSLRGLSEGGSGGHEEDCAYYDDHDPDDCDCGHYDDGSTETGEWTSPILRSFHSRGLKHLCDAIENRETNDTPGVHVHVEASDLTPEQASRVGQIYSALEPLFEGEYQREVRNYCRNIPAGDAIRNLREALKYQRENGKAADVRGTPTLDRYVTVNLQALSSHGTIEFRAMGPRYNYDLLVRWAHFCREMVNIARAEVPQSRWGQVRTFRDLIVLFSEYGQETATPSWAKTDVVKNVTLGSERRRQPNESSVDGDVMDDYARPEPVMAAALGQSINYRW